MRNSRHAPVKMTREYNLTMALAKIDTAPIDKLDDRLLESIARTHKVPVERLALRLQERLARAVA